MFSLTDPAVGVWNVLDVHNDLIVASCSSPNTPNYLVRTNFLVDMIKMDIGVFANDLEEYYKWLT